MVPVPLPARQMADRATKHLELPAAYLRLRQAIGKANSSLADLAETVARDAPLATLLVGVVDSHLYGAPRKVGSVCQAVGLLGMQRVHDVALAASVSRLLHAAATPPPGLEPFWQRSMFAALVAREFAAPAEADADLVFVSALLADIGRLLTAIEELPGPGREAAVDAAPWRADTALREMETLGFTSAQVGAALLDAWSLPAGLVRCVLLQDAPAEAGAPLAEACTVHLAARLANAWVHGKDVRNALASVEPRALEVCEPDTTALAALCGRAAERVDEFLGLLVPEFAAAA